MLVTHGGTEMGQGLHTKMVQVAAQTLDIPHEKVHCVETSTDKVPNTPPTAASAGSDLNGAAVLEACRSLSRRLAPYRAKNLDWEAAVTAAYFDRVSLSATGFHATPDIGYSFETNSGNAFNYFTYGVGCSQVEVDCLTGDHQVKRVSSYFRRNNLAAAVFLCNVTKTFLCLQVLRTDIVMDLGESINPAIDIGQVGGRPGQTRVLYCTLQVEGGFMQGYGLFAMEQLLHSPTGALLTRGPGAYKEAEYSLNRTLHTSYDLNIAVSSTPGRFMHVYIHKDPELQRRAGPVQRGATAGRRQPPGGLLQQSGRGGKQTYS